WVADPTAPWGGRADPASGSGRRPGASGQVESQVEPHLADTGVPVVPPRGGEAVDQGQPAPVLRGEAFPFHGCWPERGRLVLRALPQQVRGTSSVSAHQGQTVGASGGTEHEGLSVLPRT